MRSFLTMGMVVLATATSVQAAFVDFGLGPVPPPGVMGPFSMTPFPLDVRQVGDEVTSVASPLGGSVDFGMPLKHVRIGDGWGAWSHGYVGDVYYSTEAPQVVTLTLPPGTAAFYLYAAPNQLAPFTITVTAPDGTEVAQNVNGQAGASFFGFYATGTDTISSISVTLTDEEAQGFAVGEFGIARIPAPGALLLGIVGTGLTGWLRRRRAM